MAPREPSRTVRSRPTPTEEEAGARRRRALEEPLDFAVLETAPVVRLRVRNPLHGTQYLLHLPAFPSMEFGLCTCPDFARRGLGTCKHLEGASRWVREHPTLEPKPRRSEPDALTLWSRIDKGRATVRRGPLDGRALRAIGAALYTASEE